MAPLKPRLHTRGFCFFRFPFGAELDRLPVIADMAGQGALRRAPGGVCAGGGPSVAFRGGTDLAARRERPEPG